MDLVLKLREVRRSRAEPEGCGAPLRRRRKDHQLVRDGRAVGAMKLCQLKRLLAVYDMTEAEFFGGGVEKQIAPWELDPEQFATPALLDELQSLPKHSQRSLLAKFQLDRSRRRPEDSRAAAETSAALTFATTPSGRCWRRENPGKQDNARSCSQCKQLGALHSGVPHFDAVAAVMFGGVERSGRRGRSGSTGLSADSRFDRVDAGDADRCGDDDRVAADFEAARREALANPFRDHRRVADFRLRQDDAESSPP